MAPLRGIGTMPFPSACVISPCAHATAGSEATVAPDTAVLSKSRRVKLFIADRVYSRTIILQTFSRRKSACLTFPRALRLCTQSRCAYELEMPSVSLDAECVRYHRAFRRRESRDVSRGSRTHRRLRFARHTSA